MKYLFIVTKGTTMQHWFFIPLVFIKFGQFLCTFLGMMMMMMMEFHHPQELPR